MDEQRPGVSRSGDEMAKKLGVWIGLGLVLWAVFIVLLVVTVKAVQWLW